MAAGLREKRDYLNRIADLLHTEVEGRDYTAFRAIADVVRFIGSGRRAPILPRDGLGELTLPECERIDRRIGELAGLLETGGQRRTHPFAGCRELDLTPVQQKRLKDALSRAIKALDAALWENSTFGRGSRGDAPNAGRGEDWPHQPESVAEMYRSAALLDLLGDRTAEAVSLADAVLGKGVVGPLAESLEVGAAWAEAKREVEPLFREHAWDAPAVQLQLDLERGVADGLKSIFARFGAGYRRAR